MNPESGSFARCGRHPSQFFTGFCSSCLAERLSCVDSVERSPKLERRSCDVRVRKTLLSLFHLDDDEFGGGNAIRIGHRINGSVNDVRFDEKVNGSENVLVGINFDSSAGVSQNKNASKNVPAHEGFNSGTRIFGSKNDFENHWVRSRVSSSVSAVDDVNVNAGSVKNPRFADNENLKEKGISFWLGSVFSRKVLRWRTKSYCKKNPSQAKNENCGYEEKQLETKFDFRHSCDRRVSCDSNKAFWEDPRHSWDGFLMGKSLEIDGKNPSIYHRRKRSLPEEAMLEDSKPSTVTKDMGETSTTSLVEENTLSADKNLGQPFGGVHYEETRQDHVVPNFRWKSHGWSKVWNRSITSPFRDFIQKRENVLERSLSESWRELHREKNMEAMDMDGRVHFHGISNSCERKHHISNKSKIPSNGDLHSLRFDQQKKKDSMLGRSRSVHYSSPRNLDNGLLRFYLTPLRSSRRGATSKSRMRNSRSFPRGILGFY